MQPGNQENDISWLGRGEEKLGEETRRREGRGGKWVGGVVKRRNSSLKGLFCSSYKYVGGTLGEKSNVRPKARRGVRGEGYGEG